MPGASLTYRPWLGFRGGWCEHDHARVSLLVTTLPGDIRVQSEEVGAGPRAVEPTDDAPLLAATGIPGHELLQPNGGMHVRGASSPNATHLITRTHASTKREPGGTLARLSLGLGGDLDECLN